MLAPTLINKMPIRVVSIFNKECAAFIKNCSEFSLGSRCYNILTFTVREDLMGSVAQEHCDISQKHLFPYAHITPEIRSELWHLDRNGNIGRVVYTLDQDHHRCFAGLITNYSEEKGYSYIFFRPRYKLTNIDMPLAPNVIISYVVTHHDFDRLEITNLSIF